MKIKKKFKKKIKISYFFVLNHKKKFFYKKKINNP